MQNEIISQRLLQLPQTYRDFLYSGEVGVICKTFAEPHSLSDEDTIVLENGFVLMLLSIIDKEKFAEFVTAELNIPQEKSAVLAQTMILALPTEIQTFLSPFENIQSVDTTSKKNTQPASSTSETVSPIRTMATDSVQIGYQSTDEPVYTSVQSALLNESK